MTSNIGARQLKDFGTGVVFGTATRKEGEDEAAKGVIESALKKAFAPEFLNRIDDVVMFNSLQKEDINSIVELELNRLINRLNNIKYKFVYDPSLINLIAEVGFDEAYGARPLKRAIQDKIEDFISEEVLKGNVMENIEYELVVEEKEIKIKQRKGKKRNGG